MSQLLVIVTQMPGNEGVTNIYSYSFGLYHYFIKKSYHTNKVIEYRSNIRFLFALL